MIVDFYVLQNANAQRAWRFVCELIEEKFVVGKRIYIYVNDLEDAKRFDQLLWTYKDISFLPHDIAPANSPIQIAYHENDLIQADVCINLSNLPLPSGLAFEQMIEIVFSDEAMQQLARQRYKTYRDLGLTIHTHKRLLSS